MQPLLTQLRGIAGRLADSVDCDAGDVRIGTSLFLRELALEVPFHIFAAERVPCFGQ
jgi:hypothetical protein